MSPEVAKPPASSTNKLEACRGSLRRNLLAGKYGGTDAEERHCQDDYDSLHGYLPPIVYVAADHVWRKAETIY